jgi:hypothetical protein
MSDPLKDEKIVSFDETLERNVVLAVICLIVLVLVGLPISLSVILSILVVLYINHVKNKK